MFISFHKFLVYETCRGEFRYNVIFILIKSSYLNTNMLDIHKIYECIPIKIYYCGLGLFSLYIKMPKYYLPYNMLDVFTFYKNISFLGLETICSAARDEI